MSVVKKYQWIFLILFSHSLQECFFSKTTNYAEVAHNDSTFSMIEEDLKHLVYFFFLPQQNLYWERCNDVKMPVVYQTISKNKFRTKKIYAFGRYSKLYREDKYAKILILSVQVTVCPLYDLANNSLKQFRYWHQDYTIDERTILYFGMHSAKQTMRVKSVRFGYKNFVLASSHGILII